MPALSTHIRCSIEDVKAFEANISDTDAEFVVQVVNRINLDDVYYDDVYGFGSEIQEEHGEVAEQELAIASCEPLKKGQILLAEMIELVEALNPAIVFFGEPQGFDELLKTVLGEPDSPAKIFVEKFPKLQRLAREMRNLIGDLIRVVEDLAVINSRYEFLVRCIAYHCIAAKYIENCVNENPDRYPKASHYTSQPRIIEDRIASLLTTKAALQTGLMNNAILGTNVSNLIENAEEVIGEDLPKLQNAYTAAIIASNGSHRSPNDSWFADLAKLHDVVATKLSEGLSI